MEALDEWHLEAERAAKEKGETVVPRRGNPLLLEDELEETAEGTGWWEGCASTPVSTSTAAATVETAASSEGARGKGRGGRDHHG
ncbi:unnamed protein product [Ectocarpus sp. 12 AP-2014]